jgi:hypothetical protein
MRRARYLERTGDPAAADRALQQGRALRPISAADHFLQGDDYYRERDLKKARSGDHQGSSGDQSDGHHDHGSDG